MKVLKVSSLNIKNRIRKFIHFFGFELSNLKSFKENRIIVSKLSEDKVEIEAALNKILLILDKSVSENSKFSIEGFLKFSIDKVIKSKAQIFQDLFVLYYLNEKRTGFFVEFGATNGISLSNTYLLEKEYGWTGILAEPGIIWNSQLKSNRNCSIDNRCVWTVSGTKLIFNETENASLSQIDLYAENDFMAAKRNVRSNYEVSTISLCDLLETYNAPLSIDYLSIDTEGSEYEILKAFNFEKFKIRVITIEHNFSESRPLIFNLLSRNGYKRVFDKISLFDDWYIKV